jgi:hypothetical protein
MKNLKDVQQLINDKADARLKKDLSSISNQLYNGIGYNLLKDIYINVGTTDKPRSISLIYILSDSGLAGKIIEANTERYREEENKNFLEKVESLRNDVDELLNN